MRGRFIPTGQATLSGLTTIESIPPPLEYASPSTTPRGPSYPPLLLTILDGVAAAFLISQLAFLLEMMIVNIRLGSGYPQAPGNSTFVQSFPTLAAWIVRLPSRPFRVLGYPSFLANAITFTGFTWVVAAYLVWRAIRTRGRRRVLMILIALPTLTTLPWIVPALMMKVD